MAAASEPLVEVSDTSTTTTTTTDNLTSIKFVVNKVYADLGKGYMFYSTGDVVEVLDGLNNPTVKSLLKSNFVVVQ